MTGRVSDIWRSFVGQALFRHLGLSVGFLPRPLVVQERNPHSYEADFKAELPLYLQSKAFVSHVSREYLNNKYFKPIDDLPKSIEELWVDLYERGFVEVEDVYLVQRWIKALMDVGYKFPKTRHHRRFKGSVERAKISGIGKTVQELSKAYLDKLYQNSNHKTSTCLFNDADKGATLTFGNSDLHTGPRSDLSSLLSHLGQKIVLMGFKGNETNYPEIYKLKSVNIYDRSSPTLSRYLDHTHRLTSLGIARNVEFYSDDKVVKEIDAFVCTFPASMCQMWKPLNKSIIFLPAHRYNLGRCIAKEWRQLNEDIKQLHQDPSGRHTIAAMSRYDAEYLRYYTGIKPLLLTSFSGYYTDTNWYNPTRNEFLIFCVREGAKYFISNVVSFLSPEFSAVRVYDLYTTYTLQNLASHRAVIMLPYSVMSYRLTELYALSIPLFIPSPKFYLNHFDPESQKFGIGHDRTSTSEPYCTVQRNLESVMRPSLKSNFSSHPYSPNVDFDEDVEAEMYWLQMADFYDWPHVQLYDSLQHLKSLLPITDYQNIHRKMKAEVEIRGLELNRKWCDVIQRIKTARLKSSHP